MTAGQARALREIERLQAADPDRFELVNTPELIGARLSATVSLRLGVMDTREGGLDLREREEFTLSIPADFPFDYPSLMVTHNRFAGFPHVVWSRGICLYQSPAEWNPSDGLYGFLERLRLWLSKAAINDMDPVEGPLEPPHHITDFSQVPFLIRCNAPVPAGETWLGLAELEKHDNRMELIGWNDLSKGWPKASRLALAVILPQALPQEFPRTGKDFFAQLMKQGMDKYSILRRLALAARLSLDKEPIHLVLGMPMRRSVDGSPRLHIAVWTTAPGFREALLLVIPKETDTDEILNLRSEFAENIFTTFEKAEIVWCRVMEDRDEIVVRRDSGTPVSWFRGRKVLILGCGALGSWLGEVVARANPGLVHLVDNSIVKPGLLVRQNYRPEDIGANKAEALALRLRTISPKASVQPFVSEAHNFIFQTPGRVADYEVILDCTASTNFQMKLERDWSLLGGHTPAAISVVIDAKAKRCLAVVLKPNSPAGMWDAFVLLKQKLCMSGGEPETVSAFYSDRARMNLFQPEPGCSDPTFSGSAADVLGLASTALNLGVSQIDSGSSAVGLAFSAPDPGGQPGMLEILPLPRLDEVRLGLYRIRIQRNVYRETRACVRQNNRNRSPRHETGGLLWGLWDDAVGVIWIFDASGPPPGSLHDPGNFVCGVHGTGEEHKRRYERSHGGCGFIGYWHTHPDMPSHQSGTDMAGMAALVSSIGQNQKRAVMLIFGRTGGRSTAGVYVYESHARGEKSELISVGQAQIELEAPVV